MCPQCTQIHKLSPERLKPMVLSSNNQEMQCDVCNHSFKLPDSELIIETARRQREDMHNPDCYRCGCGELVPNDTWCIDCDSQGENWREEVEK